MVVHWNNNRNNKRCRPTSCGALYLNDGAVAFEKDPDTGELVLDEDLNPIVPISMVAARWKAICFPSAPIS